MGDSTKKSALIFDLIPDQIQSIINDITFFKDGGKIVYIIDQADIVDYCYPLSLDENNFKDRLENYQQYADRKIGLHDLFHESPFEKELILLNVYSEEIHGFRSIVNQITDFGVEIAEYTQAFEDKIPKDNKINLLISGYYSVLLSIAFGKFEKGIEAFLGMLRSGKMQSEYELKELDDLRISQTFERVYRESSPYHGVNKKLKSIYNFFKSKRSQENKKESNLRDAIAVYLVSELNKHCPPNLKFKLLSSQPVTDALTQFLYDIGNSTNQEDNELYQYTKPEHFINSSQLLATRVCRVTRNKNIDYKATISNLKQLLFYVSIYDRNKSIKEGEFYFDNVLKRREEYENYGLLAQQDLEKLKEILAQVTKHEFSSNDNSKLNILKKHLDSNNNLKKLASLKKEFNFYLLTIQDDVLGFLNDETKQRQDHVNDYIESRNQILTVNFRTNIGPKKYNQLITYLTNSFLHDSPNWQTVKKQLSDYLSSKKNHSKGDFTDILMSSVLTMMIQGNSNTDYNKKLMDYLVEQIEFYETLMLSDDFSSNDRIEFRKFIVELKYICCWAARRCNCFKIGIRIAKKALQEYGSKDPRFYQGLFLNAYSIWYSKDKQTIQVEDQIIDINYLINQAENALNTYLNSKITYTAIKETKEVLYNSLAYLYAYKFKEELKVNKIPSVEDYNKPRNNLESLKNSFSKSANLWSKHPEYHHTEGVVELFECRYLKKQDEFEKATNKKNCALSTVEAGILSAENLKRDSLLERFKTLKSRILSE